MDEQLASGTRFASYTIEGLIASGGMGRVYAARDEVYGTGVALKVLHEGLHSDPSWRKRFNEEGLVGTSLKHPHVLSARELVEHEGRIALVMDLVSGGQTLDKVVSREFPQGLSLVPGLQVFLGMVQGIEYLHTKGIVHGDVKPENVMIVGDYRNADTWVAKVTDFGTVALIAHPVVIGGIPAVVATPRYASPEHLMGLDCIEPRSDIYSLGLVLYYMLTGTHSSAARTVEEASNMVRKPVPLVALVDQPDALLDLFRAATAVDPDERIPSCRELALAVREVLDSVGAVLDLDDLKADLATEVDEERAHLKAQQAQEPPGDQTEVQLEDAEEALQDMRDPELPGVLGGRVADEGPPPRPPPGDPDDPAERPTDADERFADAPDAPIEPEPDDGPEPPGLPPLPPAAADEASERTAARPEPPPATPVPAPVAPADQPDPGGVPVWVVIAGVGAILVFIAVLITNYPY